MHALTRLLTISKFQVTDGRTVSDTNRIQWLAESFLVLMACWHASHDPFHSRRDSIPAASMTTETYKIHVRLSWQPWHLYIYAICHVTYA